MKVRDQRGRRRSKWGNFKAGLLGRGHTIFTSRELMWCYACSLDVRGDLKSNSTAQIHILSLCLRHVISRGALVGSRASSPLTFVLSQTFREAWPTCQVLLSCLWYLELWFSSCRYGVELRVMCPVCRLLQHLYNTLELLMMGIMVPETCWASNKICNKYYLLHLVGILFPHINDDARS